MEPNMTADRPTTEPRTEAGRRIVKEWLMLRPDYPANTARVRDMVLEAEAEAARGAAPRYTCESEKMLGHCLPHESIHDGTARAVVMGDLEALIEGAAPPNHVVVERLDRPGNRANLEGPTDEERLAFKRSEREAAAAIMAGDRFCPDPSAHEGAAPRAEGLPSVDDLAEAMHPTGEGTVFLACMGSSLSHIEDEEKREQEHRRYHRESAEAIIRNLIRLSRPSDERVPETCDDCGRVDGHDLEVEH